MRHLTRQFEQCVGGESLQWVPLSLTISRLALAPLMLVNAYVWQSQALFVGMLAWAIFSDIYDGVIARKLCVDTPIVRRLDSLTDTVFYLATLWAVGVVHTHVIAEYFWPIAGLILLEIACNAVSLWRFGRPPATHTYTAKCWGVFLFVSLTLLLGFGITGPVFIAMLVIGYIADVEVLVIMLVSRQPPVDVAGIWKLKHSYPHP